MVTARSELPTPRAAVGQRVVRPPGRRGRSASSSSSREEGIVQPTPTCRPAGAHSEVWDEGETFVPTEQLIARLVDAHPDTWGELSSFGKRLTAQRLGRMLTTATGSTPLARDASASVDTCAHPWSPPSAGSVSTPPRPAELAEPAEPADRCEVCDTPLHPLVIAAGTTVHATCEPVEREEVRHDGLAETSRRARERRAIASRGCDNVAGFGASPVVEAVRLNEPRFLEMGSFEHPRSHLFSLRSYHQGGEVRERAEVSARPPSQKPATHPKDHT